MAPPTPAPLRMIGRLLGAVACLAVLVALTAGVPLLLLKLGHQPRELTGGWNLLTQQDDGSLLLVVITLIGWAAWAAFTGSALLDIVARARGRSVRHIRGLGGLQSLAGFLIGSIVLLAPTAASAATPSPAVAATATHVASTASPAPTATAAATMSSDEAKWPTHTVASATEAPWDLAVTYLGDGQRWKDIAALNPDVPHISAGDQYLPQGAVIKLPSDARTTAPTTAAAAPASPTSAPHAPARERQDEHRGEKTTDTAESHPPAEASEHTVKDGENLSLIAGKTYGDPDKWPEIFEANRGEVQPGGHHFTDPDLIYPGQHLTLPHAGTTPPPTSAGRTGQHPTTSPATGPSSPPHHGDTSPAPSIPDQASGTETEHPQQPSPSASTAPAHPTQTDAPAPRTSTPAPPSQHNTPPPASTPHATDETSVPVSAVAAGVGLMAAALITTVTLRRRVQQRRLRPGRRIPMPQGRAADTEYSLRVYQHPTGFDLLDRALRTLAFNLAAAGRPLPVIEAVVLHETRVELHLAQDTVPMKPFTAAASRQDLWTCPASHPALADDEARAQTQAPYPALVSLGWDDQGHLVLVDLEHVGVLQLTGDPALCRHALQAIAVELANTPLPGHLELSLLGDTAPGLEDAVPERAARTTELAAATDELALHTQDQRYALNALGADSLREARLLEDGGDSWTPHIVLADQPTPGADTHQLLELLAAEPRTAAAVITTLAVTADPTAGTVEGAWTLVCQDKNTMIVLPGSGLPIRLQTLEDEHFSDSIEILTLASSTADVPPAPGTYADLDEEVSDGLDAFSGDAGEPLENPAEDVDAEESDEAEGEFGLPAEYADLEDRPCDDDHRAGKEDNDEEEENTGLSLEDVLAGRDTPAAPATTKPTASAPCTAPTRAIHASVLARTSHGTPTPEATTAADGPTVLLLGPLTVEGTAKRVDSNRMSRSIELAAFLALNPGADRHAIDYALWPTKIRDSARRDQAVSRTRSWLGQEHFPRISKTGDARYRLGPHVTCDWSHFQDLARTGHADHTEDGNLALRRALALVRGRPFAATDPGRYEWAAPVIEDMISAIGHAAAELSTRCREAGDIPGALWAARRGLLAAADNELLHRQIFLAHHAAGDIDALRQAAANLAKINEGEKPGDELDMETETAQLLRSLLPRHTATH
ncbi:hypothetical protein AB0M94_35395 [Streptomyces xanthochromogenes]|uniref:hypothetical protein n=1 Tax=Streptomyces xanthochromogenes TaxID=67384 RepID=UPI0034362B20